MGIDGINSEHSSRPRIMEGNVLLLSQRRLSNLVAYCLCYEFEDTMAAVTDAS